MKEYKKFFKNKTIAITGGTGSFGNAFLEKINNFEVKEIKIFSRDEKKQDDMRRIYANKSISYHIGDVRSIESLNNCLKNVDYVFHAAALKQVPSCEFYPEEALKTNVIGSSNVIKSCIKNHVKKLVMLSTDKAVYPINAMGITKAMMEKLMIANARMLDDNKLILCCTRYGNVMGSRGSVIPLFKEQIELKNEITITDPNMTRFLMSLDESVDLVLYAFKNANQGDIFVQKSPGCTIKTLADAMKLYMKSPDVKIKIIGTRHGEKQHEVLVSREEMAKSEDLGSFYRIPMDQRGLDYSSYFNEGEKKIKNFFDLTSENTRQLSKTAVVKLLESINI